MKKFEELVSKRETEIAANKRNQKDDEKNHKEAVASGILGAIVGGFYGLIFGFFAVGIGALIYSKATGSKDDFWPLVIFFGIIIFGVITGYNSSFSAKRKQSR